MFSGHSIIKRASDGHLSTSQVRVTRAFFNDALQEMRWHFTTIFVYISLMIDK